MIIPRSYVIQVVFVVQCILFVNVGAMDMKTYCPRMVQKVFDGYAPIGNKTAGVYTMHSNGTDLRVCVLDCCKLKHKCNVAFVYNKTCYHVKCVDDESCLPLKRPNITTSLQMVLVHPKADGLTWEDIVKQTNLPNNFDTTSSAEQVDIDDSMYGLPYGKFQNSLDKVLNDEYADRVLGAQFGGDDQTYNPYDADGALEEPTKYYSGTNLVVCKVDSDRTCGRFETCIPLVPQSMQGICKCIQGYERIKKGGCIKAFSTEDDSVDLDRRKLTEKLLMAKNLEEDSPMYDAKSDSGEVPAPVPASSPVQKLSVSVVSKDVQLPEKEVTLAAYTVPDEKTAGVPYEYSWSLISQPPGSVNGTTSDQSKDKIKLSNLSEGLYRFKVVVKGKGLKGEAFGNVTVLPEKRTNKPPTVIITPKMQIVKWPTSGAILDGSSSKDDDGIKSWHWDLIQGPIGYKAALQETSTLQLSDLIPGNYTFKLTVTDSDDEKNSTNAQITVLKAIDYPPSANAGRDVMLFWPNNSVILDGSASKDDREIVSWEWTKDSSVESKAVDMQNTRTPYLHLSNLELGMYTFELKVTDGSNQSSTDNVSVLVKLPDNQPPRANAGRNSTITLPQNWVTLNASASTADIKIRGYQWSQVTGPNTANIMDANSSVANATSLTVGAYEFQVVVIDENNNSSTDKVMITVVQEKNSAPVARAGGDQTVELPTSSIYVNGSQSTDDLGIVKYEWTRDSTSLAIGTVVGNTNHEPILIITNIVAGRYVFKLTVTDGQGLIGTDTVSIIVHEDPQLKNLVELTFTVGVTALTQAEMESLQQKLMLLLDDNTKLHVRDLRMEQKTGEAVLVFYVEKTVNAQTEIMAGLEVEQLLTDKLWRDSSIIGIPISDVRTTVCQNKCSGHGTCNSETRACMCQTFWMPSMYYFWGFSEANCDWSIVYVVIGVLGCFLFFTGICWGLTFFCRKRPKTRTRAKPQKYSLLETQELETPALTRETTLSDSETDSDVLFETKSKTNGILRTNGSLKNNNGQQKYTRLGRRIKA